MQKTIVTLTDDLDPTGETVADETVPFALDGKHYEIDLTHENADILRNLLQPFIQAGRPAKAGPRRVARPQTEDAAPRTTPNRPRSNNEGATIRAWATAQGMEVPARGRLSKRVADAYHAAHGNPTTQAPTQPKPPKPAAAPPADDTEPTIPLPGLFADHEGTPVKDDRPAPYTGLALVPTPAPEPKAAPEPAAEPQPAPPALKDPVTEFADAVAENGTPDDPDEAEAAKHYTPLDRFSPEAAKKKWANRTAHGCKRTNKVADMTLMERVKAIGAGGSDRNVTILGMLAGVIPLKNGNVSHLGGSATRLENLGMIQYAPESDHGWEITDFGRFAHKYHSMG